MENLSKHKLVAASNSNPVKGRARGRIQISPGTARGNPIRLRIRINAVAAADETFSIKSRTTRAAQMAAAKV